MIFILQRRILLFVTFTAVILAGCATTGEYYKNLNELVASKQYQQAAALTESQKIKAYGEKNALLYYLDRGMLLHYSGDYAASNEAFEKAKKLAADYFTKSVTTELSTLLISDNVRPYYGEDFERAMINLFCALNYVYLGKDEDALVEARQVDHFLQTLKVNYGRKNVYTEDAFARYLTGMLFENDGEINDAYISYKQALDAYGTYRKQYATLTPPGIVEDAIRTAKRLGMSDEIADIQKTWKTNYDGSAMPGGELVVIDYNGISPVKIDTFFEVSFGQGWGYVEAADVKGDEQRQVETARSIARSIASDEQVRIAFPKYTSERYRIKSMGVKLLGNNEDTKGFLVENIGAIAVKNLDDRIVRVRARAIARGVIKFVLSKQISDKVEQANGQLAGWLAKTALKTMSTATEFADKRSWRSLPDEINLARMQLPEGTHSVEVGFYDKNGSQVSSQVFDNIKIVKGKKTFISVRSAL